jgi:hypothetical protein
MKNEKVNLYKAFETLLVQTRSHVDFLAGESKFSNNLQSISESLGTALSVSKTIEETHNMKENGLAGDVAFLKLQVQRFENFVSSKHLDADFNAWCDKYPIPPF